MEKKTKCTSELLAIRDSLELLGGKWKLVILRYLINRENEEVHFKKIEREIEGISAKVLSKELKDLEENLLLLRIEEGDNRGKVLYQITPYAKTVIPLTDYLIEWGIIHRERIKEK